LSTRALWYLTRGLGVVSLLLLTCVVVLGILTTVRWARPTWPRFASQQLHRNVSLLAIVFVVVHVVTAVSDPFAPLRITDAVVPFMSQYRPLWVGLGALAFDILITVLVTSLLRLKVGLGRWRSVHWLAYACWPVAVLHGLGTGSDVRLWWFQTLTVGCVLAVVAGVWWRIAHRWPARAGIRIVAAVASVAVPAGIFAFSVRGPLESGWARRAGTPLSLLGARTAADTTATTSTATASTAPAQRLALPSTPTFSGTVQQSRRSDGTAVVAIAGGLAGAATGRLTIDLYGEPLANGGVAMTRSIVSLVTAGSRYTGSVDALSANLVSATLSDGGRSLQMQIALALRGSVATGSVRLTAAGPAS
jgi:methionine sulfoxide reductase heme-binding subunit